MRKRIITILLVMLVWLVVTSVHYHWTQPKDETVTFILEGTPVSEDSLDIVVYTVDIDGDTTRIDNWAGRDSVWVRTSLHGG